jgi:hypothetical protein
VSKRLSSNAKRLLHDKCLDDLVHRLAPKPGFLCIEAEYNIDGCKGELDIHKITRNSEGVKFNRYYEVKWRDSAYLRKKAKRQFKRHASCHEGNWQYIYVTPTSFINYTSKI